MIEFKLFTNPFLTVPTAILPFEIFMQLLW